MNTLAHAVNRQASQSPKNVICLPLGLLGFEDAKNYALLFNPQERPLMRLQMLEGAKRWFFVVRASQVLPDYQPDISDQDAEFLGLSGPADAVVLNIVTLLQGRAMANLKGPIVINRLSMVGKQIIPRNAGRFDLQHPINSGLKSKTQPDHNPPANWSDGIASELDFWDRWLSTKGLQWPEDYKRRLDPNTPVQPWYEKILDEIPADPVRVLDVGAGPLTILGRIHPRKKVLLEATDALAREYDVLLRKHGVIPPLPTTCAEAEKLTNHFAPGMFDFVHASNCIDHCAEPFLAICQMLAVARIGATVLLSHEENEAEHERYTGFHQWNFTVENGNFIIRGKGQTFNVTELLGSVAALDSHLENGWVTVHLRKLKALCEEPPSRN